MADDGGADREARCRQDGAGLMVSDVLASAVWQIDEYLSWEDVYQGKERERIVRVRDEMEAVRRLLDSPPAPRDAERTGRS